MPVDAALAEIAGRQHGVVAPGQLRAFGVSDDAVDKRAAFAEVSAQASHLASRCEFLVFRRPLAP